MKRRIHRSACAVLALLALSLTGAATSCSWKPLIVEIPDFEASQIKGVQLWRGEEETSQSVTEAGRIVFGECFLLNGWESLDYTLLNAAGEPLEVSAPAAVVRGEDGSDAVTVYFALGAWDVPPGWIRVSTFNEVGESDLSDEAVLL
jgi:hypothetical protein